MMPVTDPWHTHQRMEAVIAEPLAGLVDAVAGVLTFRAKVNLTESVTS